MPAPTKERSDAGRVEAGSCAENQSSAGEQTGWLEPAALAGAQSGRGAMGLEIMHCCHRPAILSWGGDAVQEESTSPTGWRRSPLGIGAGSKRGSGCRINKAWQRGQHRGSCPVHSRTRSAQVFRAGDPSGGSASSPSSCRQ
jgi:hypothetical protein